MCSNPSGVSRTTGAQPARRLHRALLGVTALHYSYPLHPSEGDNAALTRKSVQLATFLFCIRMFFAFFTNTWSVYQLLFH